MVNVREVTLGRKRPGYAAVRSAAGATPWLVMTASAGATAGAQDLCRLGTPKYTRTSALPGSRKGGAVRLPQDCQYGAAAGP